MSTKTITVSGKAKAKLIKQGVVVESAIDHLPPHLAKIFKNQAQKFDMHTITVNLDGYHENHPIHAII